MNGDRIAKWKKIYISHYKTFFAMKASAYIGVLPLIGLKEVTSSCFRELRCLRHKIHIGLFVTVGIANLTWLLTASLQVTRNVVIIDKKGKVKL